MKKYLRLVTSLLFITPLLAVATSGLVSAEGNNQSPTTSPTTTTNSESSGDDTVSPSDAKLLKRLEDRKTELKTSLTVAQSDRIKLKCKVAQGGGITNMEIHIKTVVSNRTAVYQYMTDRLTALETKLKAKNVDTTKLDGEITTLKTKIATFETDLTNYRQTLVDLKSMNCTTDPTGFKASLDTVRTLHQKVLSDAADIRTYVNQTIKPTLVDIKTSLAKSDSSSSKSGDSQ